MSRLPLVAIIGRPNTGKSTLFNRLVGRRIAIESEVAGTTRDHIIRKVAKDDAEYLLVDTGGMGGGTLRPGSGQADKDFEKDVHAQSTLALTAADLIIFTVDGRSELTASDQEIVRMLRRQKKRHVPVILVITKCDTDRVADEARDAFHHLGVAEDILTVSAAHSQGIEELQKIIVKHLEKLHFGKESSGRPPAENDPPQETPPSADRPPRIAIIGRPNVGKSSLINALMSDPQRKISPKLVSDIPGTTRDATDTIIMHEGQEFVFVDTAGLRRKARIEEDLEGLSVLRTIQAIEECDVAVLLIEATETVSNQDKKIAGAVIERGKGLIILVNKIDLMKGEERKEKMAEARGAFPFCRYAPFLPASAKTRDGIAKLFDLVLMAHRNRLRRIPQKELRTFIEDVTVGSPVGEVKTTKHITQAEDPPPTFVLFVRHPKNVDVSQLRYLDNRLRERFGLEGTPVKWVTKGPRQK